MGLEATLCFGLRYVFSFGMNLEGAGKYVALGVRSASGTDYKDDFWNVGLGLTFTLPGESEGSFSKTWSTDKDGKHLIEALLPVPIQIQIGVVPLSVDLYFIGDLSAELSLPQSKFTATTAMNIQASVGELR